MASTKTVQLKSLGIKLRLSFMSFACSHRFHRQSFWAPIGYFSQSTYWWFFTQNKSSCFSYLEPIDILNIDYIYIKTNFNIYFRNTIARLVKTSFMP